MSFALTILSSMSTTTAVAIDSQSGMFPPLLVYLHGFNSSPGSHKARLLTEHLAAQEYDCELLVPELPFSPVRAAARIDGLIASRKGRRVVLMGSSLGGYYAVWAAQRFALPAVLVNPAVYPYRLLRDYLGPQENPYTGERYVLEMSHMDMLEALEVGPLERPERVFVLLQTGDETLNYREALSRFEGSPQWVQPGGSHAFDNFVSTLPAALSFLGVRRR